jgi:glycine/D-amino acid oxidase-like deaminating enzyme
MPVAVIERERVGAGASGASAGNVQAITALGSPLEVTLGVESLRRWRHDLPAIKEESGIDPQDHEVRYVYAAMDEQEVADLQTLTATLQAEGVRTEWIDARAARELEPRLHPDMLGGMYHQDVVQMDAQRCVNALETIVRARGGVFIEGEVAGLRRDGNRVQAVELRDGTTVPCHRTLVLALGGWTGVAVSRWLDVSLPIQPYALQKLHVRPRGAPLGCAVRWGGLNVVTRRDGLVHVGSVHEDHGLDARPSESGRAWLMARFAAILPGVEVDIVEATAGLASFLPDPERTPMLGRLPGLDDVYVAVPTTNGFLLSSLMASTLAAYLTSGAEAPWMHQMRPDRPMTW